MAWKVYKKEIKTKFNSDEQAKTGYVLRLRQTTTIRPKELSEEISRYLSAEGGEILLAVNQLSALITREVLAGMSVKIDGLGTFYPKITSKSQSQAENVDSDSITKFTVGFRIDADFQKEISSVGITTEDLSKINHV